MSSDVDTSNLNDIHTANKYFSIIYGATYLIGAIYTFASENDKSYLVPLGLSFLCLLAYVISYATYDQSSNVKYIAYVPFGFYVLSTVTIIFALKLISK